MSRFVNFKLSWRLKPKNESNLISSVYILLLTSADAITFLILICSCILIYIHRIINWCEDVIDYEV